MLYVRYSLFFMIMVRNKSDLVLLDVWRRIICIWFILIIDELVKSAYNDIHVSSLVIYLYILICYHHTKKHRLVYFLIVVWSVVSTTYHYARFIDLRKTLGCVHLSHNEWATINLRVGERLELKIEVFLKFC